MADRWADQVAASTTSHGVSDKTKVRLLPGVRAINRLMRSAPVFSVSRMDAALLERVQRTALPERGPVNLVSGIPHRDVALELSSFPGPYGDLPLRIYRPRHASVSGAARRPLVLHLHGGGFSMGSARQGAWLCSQVAAELGAVVVAVDYRLAPTHRFPAAVEDCYAALEWVHAEARNLGADPERIAVLGDSAGGNLAAVTTLMARDRSGPVIRHQTLIYPATDLTENLKQHPSYLANTRGIVLSHADLEVFHGHYVDSDVDPTDWRLSPLYAPDLSGLPPAIVVVAGLDPLHDSGVRYAEALAAAGCSVRVEDFHLMPHGFLSFPYLSRGARPAVRAIVASQRAALT